MKAMFVHSSKFKKYKNNIYSQQFSYEIWRDRYLRYFDELHVVSRVEEVSSTEGYSISNGENVKHYFIPDFMTPLKFLKDRSSAYKMLENYILKNSIDIVIVRLPSAYSLLAIKVAKKFGLKIVVEMVGDPLISLWTHGSLKGKIYAPIAYLKYKRQLQKLNNIIFVTERYLQTRYKPDYKRVNSTNISNVNLLENKGFDLKRRKIKESLADNKDIIKISTIGSYSSKYKGFDTAIEFIYELRRLGYNTHLFILGSGDKRPLEKIIKKYNLEGYIHFEPRIQSGKEVLDWLDNFDLYIQPSLTEGLPRALIEAMSRGIPSIATNVGGIPELLDEKMLVNKKSPNEMITIAKSLINNKDFYNEQVERNYNRSKKYFPENLTAKRDVFWSKLL